MPDPSYYGPLQSFLSYIDNTEYERRHEHSQERLRAITPKDIGRWMNWRLFDCEEPADNATKEASKQCGFLEESSFCVYAK